MSVQIVTLVTGEKLICDLNELFDDEEKTKGIGFVFKLPYALTYEGEKENEVSVRFDLWNPFSIDKLFQVPYERVVCVSVPQPNLQELYLEKTGLEIPESSSNPLHPEVLRG